MYIYADVSNLSHAAANSQSGGQPLDEFQVALNVVQQIAQIVRSYNATRIYWFLDSKEGSWRKEIFPNYKAQRKENLQKDPIRLAADAVANQVIHNVLPELITLTATPAFRFPFLEADDLCAAAVCLNEEKPGIMVTADKDYWQLLRPNLFALNPIHSYMVKLDHEGKIVKHKGDGTQECLKMSPDQFLLSKAIQGDKSDNIPGLIGIGEVTADKRVIEGTVAQLLTEETGMVTPRKPKNNPNPTPVMQDARAVVIKNLELVSLKKSRVFEKATKIVRSIEEISIREPVTKHSDMKMWLMNHLQFEESNASIMATGITNTFMRLWTV